MVLALPLLLFFELLVDLQQDTEAKIVPHDLKPRQILDELVDQLQACRCVQRASLHRHESIAFAATAGESAQIWVVLTKLLNDVLDLF